MKKYFPTMFSHPQSSLVVSIVSYWGWAFVLVPWWLPFMSMGLWENQKYASWLQIGYYTLNGLVTAGILKNYLKDEWFMITTAPGYYLGHSAVTVGLMVSSVILQMGFFRALGGDISYVFAGLPVTEMFVTQTSGFMVRSNPVFATVCTALVSPVCVCGLFYAVGFAPLGCKHPWLAYICTAVVTLIPVVVDIIWRGNFVFMMDVYFLRLPIHLLACWSYQKTDNIFTPMFSLSVMNFLGALANIFLQ